MSNFDAIPDLLALILEEQHRLAIVSLAEAIAGVRAINDTIMAISKAKSVEADGIPAVDELFPKSAPTLAGPVTVTPTPAATAAPAPVVESPSEPLTRLPGIKGNDVVR